MKKFLLAFPFRFVGDEPVTDENTETDDDGNIVEKKVTPPGKKPKVTFTAEQQAYVNSLLAEDNRKAKEKIEKHVTQLETQRNLAGTTAAEKERLEAQIEELRSTYTTEKEMTEKERKKQDAKREKEINDAKAEANTWKTRFTKTQIKRALVDAASVKEHKAINPNHIVALLSEDTRLVEDMDEEGKPTGDYVAKVKIRTIKDGKPQTLDLIATEAVKFISEQEEHAGLFDSGVSGGLGSNPNRPRKGVSSDPNSPPIDQAAYRQWRKENPEAVGATRRSSK